MEVYYLGKDLNLYSVRELRTFLSERGKPSPRLKRDIVIKMRVVLLKEALMQVSI